MIIYILSIPMSSRLIAGQRYKPIEEFQKHYDNYRYFQQCMIATESIELYKNYSKERNKLEARLLYNL